MSNNVEIRFLFSGKFQNEPEINRGFGPVSVRLIDLTYNKYLLVYFFHLWNMYRWLEKKDAASLMY